jgi:hypothetical protein
MMCCTELTAGQAPRSGCPTPSIAGCYLRSSILALQTRWTWTAWSGSAAGIAFFVTLQKTEKDYSPTTMYEDYLISSEQFHWQSQSGTSAESPTGQRYIRHRQLETLT